MTNYQYMVVNDTNNVIDYLFGSNQYKIIRGASLLLDYLNTNAAKALITEHNGYLLSTGGGEARVLFEKHEDAIAYEKALNALYIRETDHVTITSVTVARQSNETLAKWLERTEQQLRLAEVTVGKKQLHQIAISPIMQRCENCYNRVAEVVVRDIDEHKKMCRSCYLKKQQLERVIEQVKSQDEQSYSGLSEVHKRLAKKDQKGTSWVRSIDGLFEEETTGNRIGFIYADGKNIGSLFKQVLDSKELSDEQFIKQYKEKSEKLHDALIEAAAETHEKLAQLGYKDVPVDYALIGGDDLAAILPGHVALLYTYYLVKYFEDKTEKYLGKRYQLAAGVIIAKKKYPIHQLFELSYELMDRTKSRNDVGTFDFQVLLDSYVQSIDFKRANSPIANNRHLYSEGYTVDTASTFSFEKLYETARALKMADFPSSKIKGVYHLTVEENPHMLTFKWKEWLSHLEPKHRNILQKHYPKLKDTPFCLEKADNYYTPVRDIFEVYDLVKEEVSLG